VLRVLLDAYLSGGAMGNSTSRPISKIYAYGATKAAAR